MSIYWLGFAVLALVSSCVLAQKLSAARSRQYWVDLPNERSLHRRPIPRTGGLAILGGVIIGLAVPVTINWPDGGEPNRANLAWILVTALLVGGVSLLEDRRGLGRGIRLGVHLFAAAAFVWGTRLTVDRIVVPGLVSITLGGSASGILTVLSIVWMANLYNFMDGMDGFAGGMTVVGFGFLGGIAWNGMHPALAAASLVTAASAGGFLVHNFPPARIFMGDCGSITLGYLVATLALIGIHDGLFDIWVPLLIFSPFIGDATITLIRRLLRGERVWEAHREHYYQRLVLAGWGHRRAVFIEYRLMVFCGAAAIVYLKSGETGKLVVLCASLVVYLALARSVESLEVHHGERHKHLA